VLAGATEPLTAQQVLDELPEQLAYTTVMTTLTRLTEKGALTRTPTSTRAFAYALSGTADDVPAALAARRMSRLLDAGPDRAGTLARFVAELGPDDERLLTELLGQVREAEDD
jgi:predicted transcriptional regulator